MEELKTLEDTKGQLEKREAADRQAAHDRALQAVEDARNDIEQAIIEDENYYTHAVEKSSSIDPASDREDFSAEDVYSVSEGE